MKTRGGRKQGVGKGKNPTSTSREDVPEEEQEQVHEPEDPGEKQIESVISEPDIPFLARPRKRQHTNVVKGKIFIRFIPQFSITLQ
jgi:hypothetical protein